jgi:hypothetical protein
VVALLNMRVTADFAELNCLGEKLDIWMKGQDAPHFEPLASKWIETGQEFRDEVKQRIDLLGEKSSSGRFLLYVTRRFTDVADWDMSKHASGETSTQIIRIQTDDVDSEGDSERECLDGGSEASVEVEESQSSMITGANGNKVLALEGLQDESSTAQLLSSLAFACLKESCPVEEQVDMFLQMSFFLDSEELTPSLHAVLRSFVRRALKIPTSHLFILGNFLDDWDDLDGAFKIFSVAYSRVEQQENPKNS